MTQTDNNKFWVPDQFFEILRIWVCFNYYLNNWNKFGCMKFQDRVGVYLERVYFIYTPSIEALKNFTREYKKRFLFKK